MKQNDKHWVTSPGLKFQPPMCPYHLSMGPPHRESSPHTKEQVGSVVPQNAVPGTHFLLLLTSFARHSMWIPCNSPRPSPRVTSRVAEGTFPLSPLMMPSLTKAWCVSCQNVKLVLWQSLHHLSSIRNGKQFTLFVWIQFLLAHISAVQVMECRSYFIFQLGKHGINISSPIIFTGHWTWLQFVLFVSNLQTSFPQKAGFKGFNPPIVSYIEMMEVFLSTEVSMEPYETRTCTSCSNCRVALSKFNGSVGGAVVGAVAVGALVKRTALRFGPSWTRRHGKRRGWPCGAELWYIFIYIINIYIYIRITYINIHRLCSNLKKSIYNRTSMNIIFFDMYFCNETDKIYTWNLKHIFTLETWCAACGCRHHHDHHDALTAACGTSRVPIIIWSFPFNLDDDTVFHKKSPLQHYMDLDAPCEPRLWCQPLGTTMATINGVLSMRPSPEAQWPFHGTHGIPRFSCNKETRSDKVW